MWTEQRIADLKRLWADGKSASQIANELGECSRNAVISKVHRMNLPTRDRHSRFIGAPRKPPEPRARPDRISAQSRRNGSGNSGNGGGLGAMLKRVSRPAKPTWRDVPDPPTPVAPLMVPIDGLTDTICKWPIGDPAEPGFGFCGHPKPADCPLSVPYCPHHMRIAYQPARERTAA